MASLLLPTINLKKSFSSSQAHFFSVSHAEEPQKHRSTDLLGVFWQKGWNSSFIE